MCMCKWLCLDLGATCETLGVSNMWVGGGESSGGPGGQGI